MTLVPLSKLEAIKVEYEFHLTQPSCQMLRGHGIIMLVQNNPSCPVA